MKGFAATILLLLNFTSILYVVSGRRKCRVCTELQQINSKLADLEQIDAKLDQINTTLAKLLAKGGEFLKFFSSKLDERKESVKKNTNQLRGFFHFCTFSKTYFRVFPFTIETDVLFHQLRDRSLIMSQ